MKMFLPKPNQTTRKKLPSFQKHLEVLLKIKNVGMNDIFLSHCLLKDWHLLTSLYLYVGLPHTIYCQ